MTRPRSSICLQTMTRGKLCPRIHCLINCFLLLWLMTQVRPGHSNLHPLWSNQYPWRGEWTVDLSENRTFFWWDRLKLVGGAYSDNWQVVICDWWKTRRGCVIFCLLYWGLFSLNCCFTPLFAREKVHDPASRRRPCGVNTRCWSLNTTSSCLLAYWSASKPLFRNWTKQKEAVLLTHSKWFIYRNACALFRKWLYLSWFLGSSWILGACSWADV